MLKKIVLATAVATALASVSFAMTNPDFIENVPGITFRTSNNVKIAYKHDLNAKPQAYNIISKHTSGDTYYATSNNSTTIFKKGDTQLYTGVALTMADPVVSGQPAAGESLWDGWTPM